MAGRTCSSRRLLAVVSREWRRSADMKAAGLTRHPNCAFIHDSSCHEHVEPAKPSYGTVMNPSWCARTCPAQTRNTFETESERTAAVVTDAEGICACGANLLPTLTLALTLTLP